MTVRAPVFFANWKMNHGPSQARAFMAAFLQRFTPRDDRTVALFPPALSLAAARDARGPRHDIHLGVQNIYTEEKGAYTGESSAPMARDAGARFALVGHSERRHVFGETDAETAAKCAVAVRCGLTPVLCVGETLEEREAGTTMAIVERQLRAGVGQIDRGALGGIVIAYEPVWAIGTGRSATPADATETQTAIRGVLRGLGGEAASAIPIAYGGSVNVGNAEALLGAENVDGLLVGGASLEPESWSAICQAGRGRGRP